MGARQVKPKKMVATKTAINVNRLAKVALKAMGSPMLLPKLARKGSEVLTQNMTSNTASYYLVKATLHHNVD